MSIEYSWDSTYAPAEAERGKFLPIDTPSLTSLGYPVTGRGKYAEMVYITNPEDIIVSISSMTFNMSATNVNIDEPITISVGNMTQMSAVSLLADAVSTINFSPIVNTIEVYNNDASKKAYLLFGTSTYSTVTSMGMPIGPGAYYSIDRKTTQLSLASNSNEVEVRVFGHYEV